jgi:hypothetical protein
VKVELWDIDDVIPYQKNPRLNDDAVEAVAKSIQAFGFRQPVVVDSEGIIIVGHTRWKAARKLGLQKIPVHVATDLTPDQVKAYRLADNQTNTLSEWDYALLPAELQDLRASNFDLSLLGFDPSELAELLDPDGAAGKADPDNIPAPPDAATSKNGDIYLLGEHRLMCGDSGNPDDLDKLLAGAKIHLVNTDPPYNVKVASRSNNAIPWAGKGWTWPSARASTRSIRNCGPRTGRWPTTLSATSNSPLFSVSGSATSRACWSPGAVSTSGADTSTSPTIRPPWPSPSSTSAK